METHVFLSVCLSPFQELPEVPEILRLLRMHESVYQVSMEVSWEQSADRPLGQWFDRLLDRLEQGLGVPFLGAGMSASARVARTSLGAPTDYAPTTRWLNRQLVRMLLPVLETEEGRKRLGSSVFTDAWLHYREVRHGDGSKKSGGGQSAKCRRERRLPGPEANAWALNVLAWRARRAKDPTSEARALDDLAASARNGLNYLAEAAIGEFEAAIGESGAAKVCRELKVELFAQLEPTSAHVYLAYLAREGLVTRVLTTNYDTCVEKAFERTFHSDERRGSQRQRYSMGPPPIAGDRAEELDATEELQVITCVEQYRERGGRVRTPAGPRDGRPTLRVFKLNGCALEYWQQTLPRADAPERGDRPGREDGPNPRRSAADRIILTERQLQSFRKESWAQGLFQDCARCGSFIFVGFGSEEPQIRHTALGVMAEWGSNGSKPCWELPNAPFMSAYDPGLSFTQTQVMRGYLEAHKCDTCPERDRNLCAKRQPQHCFTGEDADWFKDGPDGTGATPSRARLGRHRSSNLPADVFWQRVFQASFVRQASHCCEEGSPFRRWVADCMGKGEFLRTLTSLLDWLWPNREATSRQAASAKRLPPKVGMGAMGNAPGVSPDPPQPWRTRFQLLDPNEPSFPPDPVHPLRLSVWLMAVQGSLERWQRAGYPSHPYFPLRENPILVLGTLLVTSLLLQQDKVTDSTPEDKRTRSESQKALRPEPEALGLRVPLPAIAHSGRDGDPRDGEEWPASHGSSSVWLISQEWAESNPSEPLREGDLVRQIVIPTLARLPHTSRVQRAASGVVRVGRCVRISAEQYLAARSASRAVSEDASGNKAHSATAAQARLLRVFAEAKPHLARSRLTRLPSLLAAPAASGETV